MSELQQHNMAPRSEGAKVPLGLVMVSCASNVPTIQVMITFHLQRAVLLPMDRSIGLGAWVISPHTPAFPRLCTPGFQVTVTLLHKRMDDMSDEVRQLTRSKTTQKGDRASQLPASEHRWCCNSLAQEPSLLQPSYRICPGLQRFDIPSFAFLTDN